MKYKRELPKKPTKIYQDKKTVSLSNGQKSSLKKLQRYGLNPK
jgi:hypothetical protein